MNVRMGTPQTTPLIEVLIPYVQPQKGETGRLAGQSHGAPLRSLADGPMAGRFCAWRGASDRRYVTSVYAVDRGGRDFGLPDFEAFVLIAVSHVRGGHGALERRILGVTTIERRSERSTALALGLERGVEEWHVHFLAEDGSARAAMVADLRDRHGIGALTACA